MRKIFTLSLAMLFSICYYSFSQIPNEWEETSLINEDIRAVAVVNNHIFAASFGKGVFVSTDDGDNWLQQNNGLTNQYVTTLTLDGTFIYAGTWGGGLFISYDYGSNWTHLNLGIDEIFINSIMFDSHRVLVTTKNSGIFISNDYDNSWTQVIEGLENLNINCMIKYYDVILIGTDKGMYSSSDNGTNWALLENELKNLNVTSFFKLYLNLLEKYRLYVGTENNGVYTALNEDISLELNGLDNHNISSVYGYFVHILAATDYGVFVTYDSEYNEWSEFGLQEYAVYGFERNGYYVFAASSNGVYKCFIPVNPSVESQTDTEPDLIKIYPNPAQNFVSVNLEPLSFIEAKLYLTNKLGMLLKEINITNRNQNNSINLNISDLPSGFYSIYITSKEKHYRKNLMIIR